jgi:hypothetical protein
MKRAKKTNKRGRKPQTQSSGEGRAKSKFTDPAPEQEKKLTGRGQHT